jgi:orotate phosphoribosyltransferase
MGETESVTWFDRDRLIALLQRDALRTGRFTLASGRTSHYYVDGRQVTLSAEGAMLIAEGMLGLMSDLPGVAAVGGLTMGADPIVGAMLAWAPRFGRMDLRGFLVRKEPKGHGTGRQVEGPLRAEDSVVIVDDVATTGGSSLKAIDAVQAMGCVVARVMVVLDRLEGASFAFAERGVEYRPLLTIRDLGIEPLAIEPIGVEPLPDLGTL